jgi:peptidoglycan/LPS O-acetylase OafA/YrhL
MLAPTTRPADRRLPALVAVALAAGLLAAMLPALAAVPGRTSAPVGPLAAPAPASAILTSADFPEQARPGTACAAILDRSSAIDNRRAEVAGSITTTLLEDACFGA